LTDVNYFPLMPHDRILPIFHLKREISIFDESLSAHLFHDGFSNGRSGTSMRVKIGLAADREDLITILITRRAEFHGLARG